MKFKKFYIFVLFFFLYFNIGFVKNAFSQTQFLNIVADNSLSFVLDDFMNELAKEKNLIVNIKYVDSEFFKKNFLQLRKKEKIDFVFTKEELSKEFKEKFNITNKLDLGFQRYSFCLSQMQIDLDDEKKYKEFLHTENDDNLKSFDEILNILSNKHIIRKINIGFIENFIQKNNNSKKNQFLYFAKLSGILNAFKNQYLNAAIIPAYFCKEWNKNKLDLISIDFNQNSIENNFYYWLFSANEIKEDEFELILEFKKNFFNKNLKTN